MDSSLMDLANWKFKSITTIFKIWAKSVVDSDANPLRGFLGYFQS